MKKITKALLALTLSLLMLAAPISVNQLYANENILTEVTSDTINNILTTNMIVKQMATPQNVVIS